MFSGVASAAFFAFAMLFAPAASANTFEGNQDNSLRESLDLFGAFVEDVAVGSDGPVYVGTSGPNGFWQSADAGATWTGMPSGSDIGAVADVESGGAGEIYMVAGIDLYRSLDSGATWTLLDDGEGNDFAQNFAVSNNTVAAPKRDGRIAISSDQGDNFNVSSVGGDGDSLYGIAVGADGIYALAGSEDSKALYFLAFGEASFEAQEVSGDYEAIGIHPTDSDYIVVAGDDGAMYTSTGVDGSWSDMGSAEIGNKENIQNVSISSSGLVMAGPQYTDDNGATWIDIPGSVESKDSVLKGNAHAIDSANGRYYIQSGRGVALSTDLENWEDKVNGMLGVTVSSIQQDESKEIVWLAVQGGFAKTENFYSALQAGNDPIWEYPIYPDVTGDEDSNVDSGTLAWLHPENADIVITGQDSAFWRSTDGGDTWSELSIAVESESRSSTGAIAYDAENDIAYIGYYYSEGGDGDDVGGGVLKSTDNGATWTDLNMDNAPANPLAVDANGGLLVGLGVEMDETTDYRGLNYYDGSSWTRVTSSSSHPLAGKWVKDLMYVPATDTMFASVGVSANELGGLFVSTDSENGWQEWSQVTNGIPGDFWGQGLGVEPGVGGSVYAATARPAGTGSIYKCKKDGSKCDTFYTGLKDEVFSDLLFDGLLSGSSAGLFEYKSKVTLGLKKKQFAANSEQKAEGKVKLVATLKDATLNGKLKNRPVQLWRKKGKNGTWKKVRTKRTNNKGKAKFVVRRRSKKHNFYQVRFKPKSAKDKEEYKAVTRSRRRKIKKLPTA